MSFVFTAIGNLIYSLSGAGCNPEEQIVQAISYLLFRLVSLISMNADILRLTKTKPRYYLNFIYRKRRLKWKGWS